MKKRKRITYRPSKASGIVGGVAGGLFVLLGIFVVIPTFGAFGILWTLFALVIAVSSLYQAFGKKYVGPEIHMEEDGAPAAPGGEPIGLDAQQRLEQLQRLLDAGLITREEYEDKRAEILRGL